MFQDIISHNQDRIKNIYNSFEKVKDESVIEKGLSIDDFNKKFGAGYEVYTPGALLKFKQKAESTGIEKGLTGELIGIEVKKSLEGLQRVKVQDETGKMTDLFVRRAVSNKE